MKVFLDYYCQFSASVLLNQEFDQAVFGKITFLNFNHSSSPVFNYTDAESLKFNCNYTQKSWYYFYFYFEAVLP